MGNVKHKILLFAVSVIVGVLTVRPYAEMVASKLQFEYPSEVDIAPGIGVAAIFRSMVYVVFLIAFFVVIGVLTFQAKYRSIKIQWDLAARPNNYFALIMKGLLLIVTIAIAWNEMTNPFYSAYGRWIVVLHILLSSFWILIVMEERMQLRRDKGY